MDVASRAAVEYRIATKDPLVFKQESLDNCFDLFAGLARAEDPQQVEDHLAAFEAALFNTKSAMQGQAAVAMRAEAEAEFLRGRDAETRAARDAAVAEIGRLKKKLQDAQKERSQKAEREAMARGIAKLPEKDVLHGKIAKAKAALAGLEEQLEQASTTLARRRAQFTALLRCVRDLEEILDEETAADAAEGGIATSGDLVQEQAALSASSASAASPAAAGGFVPGSAEASAHTVVASGPAPFEERPSTSPRTVATALARSGGGGGGEGNGGDDDDDELEEGEA